MVSVPVLANGDINSREDAARCLEITGADGVMIGRGALGNPWMFNEIRNTNPPAGGTKLRNCEIDMGRRARVVMRHASLHLARYGENSMTTFRKHLAYYFKGIPGIKKNMPALMKVGTYQDLEKILSALV